MSADQNPAVDQETIESLRELMEDEFDDLVNEFLEDTTKLLANLQQAVQTGDPVALRRDAHALKSSSANMGAMTLSGFARDMERLGGEGVTEPAVSLVEQATTEFVTVRSELEALMEQTSA